jgi:hypothetical protein
MQKMGGHTLFMTNLEFEWQFFGWYLSWTTNYKRFFKKLSESLYIYNIIGLSQCLRIYLNIDVVLHQYRVNLGQNPYWVAQGKDKGDWNWTCSDCHMPCGD